VVAVGADVIAVSLHALDPCRSSLLCCSARSSRLTGSFLVEGFGHTGRAWLVVAFGLLSS